MKIEVGKPIEKELRLLILETLSKDQKSGCLSEGRSESTINEILYRRSNITKGNIKTAENMLRLTIQLTEYKLRKLKA
jgi:hypothetical protein